MTMPFSSMPSTNSSSSASFVGDSAIALAARVDRLQDRRETDRPQRRVDIARGTKACERGLWKPARAERLAHHELVGEEMSRLRADPGQAELLGDGRDDRNGAIRRDRECTARPEPARDLDDPSDLGEVDHLGDVGGGEPGRIGVPVDCRGAQTAGAGLLDRAPLVTARADEEDGLHGRRC
jgi:hypothetical protein